MSEIKTDFDAMVKTVLDGFECCTPTYPGCGELCQKCPYQGDEGIVSDDCIDTLMRDAKTVIITQASVLEQHGIAIIQYGGTRTTDRRQNDGHE